MVKGVAFFGKEKMVVTEKKKLIAWPGGPFRVHNTF